MGLGYSVTFYFSPFVIIVRSFVHSCQQSPSNKKTFCDAKAVPAHVSCDGVPICGRFDHLLHCSFPLTCFFPNCRGDSQIKPQQYRLSETRMHTVWIPGTFSLSGEECK